MTLRVTFVLVKLSVCILFIVLFYSLVVILVDTSHTHVVVEFTEEECTGVVPLLCIRGNFLAGERVSVLWNNRKEYPAIFLFSGDKNLSCNKMWIYYIIA